MQRFSILVNFTLIEGLLQLQEFQLRIQPTKKLFFKKQLLLKTVFSSTPLVAASDELIHTLKTANIYLFKVNNRNAERCEIYSINKDTKTTVCYYHVTFQSESTRYICLNVQELLPRNRRRMSSLNDCEEIKSYNHLVHKRTLSYFAKLDVVVHFIGNFEQISNLVPVSLLLTLN